MRNTSPAIVAVATPNTITLSRYLSRLSVFSEDSKYRGNILSWDQTKKTNAFGYVGHNLPSDIVLDFFNQCTSNDLSEFEIRLLKSLLSQALIRRCNDNIYRRISPFYVIGHVVGDYSTRSHEISHALYALSPEYHDTVADLYSTMTSRELLNVKQCLHRRGYADDLHQDEYGAYVLENDNEIIKTSGTSNSERLGLNQCFSEQTIPLVNLIIDSSSSDSVTTRTNKAKPTKMKKNKTKKSRRK